MLCAQPAFRTPAQVRQGNTLRIEASGLTASDGLTATFHEKTIRLFPAGAGQALGLMPVPATLKPGGYPLSVRDRSGASVYDARIRVIDARFRKQNVAASKSMKELKPLPGETEILREFNQTVSEKRFWREPFARPVPGCLISPYGFERLHNGVSTGNYHRGIDLRTPAGRPVKAAADGVVKVAGMFQLPGGTVGIDHGQGVLSAYLHLSKLAVEKGAHVSRGDVVGYAGSTGFSTGPHLHWQILVNGLPVNPLEWAPGIQVCK